MIYKLLYIYKLKFKEDKILDIIINGAIGKMGKAIYDIAKNSDNDINVVAGVDVKSGDSDIKIYDDIFNVSENADVIVDFSNPRAIESLSEFALKKRIPLVVGTTGLTDEHKYMLSKAAEDVAVFVSHNMCLGVFLIMNLARKAAKVLKDYDIEIVEKHHNQKIDAPSGTALMIADAIKKEKTDAEYVYSREDKYQKRDKNEIGIHSIRAGNIVGEHQVIFGGEDEVIEITHKLGSRKVLALGALRAAAFTVLQKPGLYNMEDLVRKLGN